MAEEQGTVGWQQPSALRPPADFAPGENYGDRLAAFTRGEGPHLWRTLGYRRLAWAPGLTSIGWLADAAYSFPSAGGPIIQGGLVTAMLDAAMGGATWTALDREQAFLTADLRVEFLRSSHPGELVATGVVVRRTRRVVFAAAELFDAGGTQLAAARATQVVLPASGRAGRYITALPSGPGTGELSTGELGTGELSTGELSTGEPTTDEQQEDAG